MDAVIYLWLEGGVAGAHPLGSGGGGGGTAGQRRPVLVCQQDRLLDASCPVPGVKVGEKRSRLSQLCPEALVVSYDPGASEKRARQFWDLLTGVSPVVDPEGENRVYLGWNTAWPERVEALLAGVARRVVPAWGYRLLGALASSKVVARGAVQWLYDVLAAGQRPRLPGSVRGRLGPMAEGEGVKGWWLQLEREGEKDFWSSLPVRYLWPLTPEVVERFLRLGLYRIGDVARLEPEVLALRFGSLGATISRLARGEGPDEVHPRHPPERVERRLHFPDPVYDYTALAGAVRWLAREAAAALERKGCSARELVLEVEWEGGGYGRIERRLPCGERGPARLAVLAGLLWERLLLGGGGQCGAGPGRAKAGVQGVRLLAGGLQEAGLGQLQLFPGEGPISSRTEDERLRAVLRGLRERYAREVVRVGMTPTRRQLMLSLYA